MALLLAALLALISFSVGVRADDTELKRLQTMLAVINQEIQAAYEQYQIVIQTRRKALQGETEEYVYAPDIQDFEEVKQRQREAKRRDGELTDQMDRILANIKELEARKQPVLNRIYELLQERSAPASEAVQPTPPASTAPPRPTGGY